MLAIFRVLLIGLVAITLVAAEFSLVVTPDRKGYLEIKHENIEDGKEYRICCNNRADATQLTARNRSYRNGLPIYRIPLKGLAQPGNDKFVCVIYEVGKKEYKPVQAAKLTKVQQQKVAPPTIPFKVELVDTRLMALQRQLQINTDQLQFNPEHMQIIEEIRKAQIDYIAKVQRQQEQQGNRMHVGPNDIPVGEKIRRPLAKHKRRGNSKGSSSKKSSKRETKIDESAFLDEKFNRSFESQPALDQFIAFPAKDGLRQALEGRKVYLSLTTSPQRLPHVHHVLMSFESDLLHEIYICIPTHFRNDPNERYVIPTDLGRLFPKLRIIIASYDPGPCLKMVGSAKYLKERGASPDDLLIYIDDDIAYSNVMVDTLVMLALATPDAAIGGSGLNQGIVPFGLAPLSQDRKPMLQSTRILEGFAGVIAPLKAIDDELILAFCDSITPSCTFSDDFIVSWIYAYNGFQLYEIDRSAPLNFYSRSTAKEFPHASLSALKNKQHDNPGSSGFGANYDRYVQAAYFLLLTTLDLEADNLDYKSREEIIEMLRRLRKKQITLHSLF